MVLDKNVEKNSSPQTGSDILYGHVIETFWQYFHTEDDNCVNHTCMVVQGCVSHWPR